MNRTLACWVILAASAALQACQEPRGAHQAQVDIEAERATTEFLRTAPMPPPAAGPLALPYKAQTVRAGTGALAEDGKLVSVHYTGRLTNEKTFDTSLGGQPIRFVLGKHVVIDGWEMGIRGMRVGEKRRLTIPPELGYGARGAPPEVPPNATLLFDVELVGVQ